MSEFAADITIINSKDVQLSSNYSCHTWMLDTGRLLICTENGEIILLENSGEFFNFVSTSPMNGMKITCVVPYSKGFLIGSETGEVILYERTEDSRHPYTKRKNF